MRGVVALAITASALASGPGVWASFDSSGVASHSISAHEIDGPTEPASAAGTCTPAVTDRIVLTWSASPSSWADGYEILRSTNPGGPFSVVASVSGVGTVSYTDEPLAWTTTYHYRVRAVKHEWRSDPTTTVQRTTRSLLCV